MRPNAFGVALHLLPDKIINHRNTNHLMRNSLNSYSSAISYLKRMTPLLMKSRFRLRQSGITVFL
jgi:hypothetical protein